MQDISTDPRTLARELQTWLAKRSTGGTLPRSSYFDLKYHLSQLMWHSVDFYPDDPDDTLREGVHALADAVGCNLADYRYGVAIALRNGEPCWSVSFRPELLADPLFAPRIETAIKLIVGKEREAETVAATDGKPATPASKPVKLPTLQPHDLQAWRLEQLGGMTQQAIADKLNEEHGTNYRQDNVSRMIRRAKEHTEASKLAELIPPPAERETAINPDRLELGARQDHRTQRQRPRANTPVED